MNDAIIFGMKLNWIWVGKWFEFDDEMKFIGL
jgi:hypothetical protein